jgi:hypothetical protein
LAGAAIQIFGPVASVARRTSARNSMTAVKILEAVLGPDHPNTKTAREKRDQLR